MNLLVMSLVSAAALSFTSCSSNDDLDDNKAGQEKVDGFYMTLSIQTPKANGTRTSQVERTTKEATENEAKITTGTFYLYDGDKCIFKKQITEADWQQKTSDKQNTGITNAIKVSVNGVAENHPYHVYFLAGEKTSNTPIVDEFTGTYTIDKNNPTSISLDLAKAGSFVMFNQNDAQHHLGGDAATVTFTSENKTATNPAKCENIYLDRAAARIDAPNAANATKITTGTGDNAPATKNLDLVENIAYQNYAVSNLNTKTNVMQKWDSEYKNSLLQQVIMFLTMILMVTSTTTMVAWLTLVLLLQPIFWRIQQLPLKMLQHCISATRQTLPLHQIRISRMVHSIVMMARSIHHSSRFSMILLLSIHLLTQQQTPRLLQQRL